MISRSVVFENDFEMLWSARNAIFWCSSPQFDGKNIRHQLKIKYDTNYIQTHLKIRVKVEISSAFYDAGRGYPISQKITRN